MKQSKRARKKRWRCVCKPRPPLEVGIQGICKAKNCTEFRCPRCNGLLAGWGPMGCKCEGYVRWLWHPGMMPALDPVAVKPSLPKGRRHK